MNVPMANIHFNNPLSEEYKLKLTTQELEDYNLKGDFLWNEQKEVVKQLFKEVKETEENFEKFILQFLEKFKPIDNFWAYRLLRNWTEKNMSRILFDYKEKKKQTFKKERKSLYRLK